MSNPIVTFEMENGKKIEIELYPEIAPISCENFESKRSFIPKLLRIL